MCDDEDECTTAVNCPVLWTTAVNRPVMGLLSNCPTSPTSHLASDPNPGTEAEPFPEDSAPAQLVVTPTAARAPAPPSQHSLSSAVPFESNPGEDDPDFYYDVL